MNEIEPHEDSTTFAVAIASREWQEQERDTRRFYELTGGTYKVVPIAIQHARIIAIAVKLDDILENPDFSTEAAQNLFQFALSEIVQHEAPDENTGKVADEMSRIFNRLMVENNESDLKLILKRAVEAKKMAATLGISPERVFEDDSLYEEVVRRTLTAQQFIDQKKGAYEKVTPESLSEIILQTMLVGSDESPIPVTAVARELIALPEVKEKIRMIVDNWQSTRYQITAENVNRFWPDYTQ